MAIGDPRDVIPGLGNFSADDDNVVTKDYLDGKFKALAKDLLEAEQRAFQFSLADAEWDAFNDDDWRQDE